MRWVNGGTGTKLSFLLRDLVDPGAGTRGLPLFDQFLCVRHFGGLQLLGEQVALPTGLLVTLDGGQHQPHVCVGFVREMLHAAASKAIAQSIIVRFLIRTSFIVSTPKTDSMGEKLNLLDLRMYFVARLSRGINGLGMNSPPGTQDMPPWVRIK